MKTIYTILIIAILSPLFFISFKHKEVSNLEKHQQLKQHYHNLMEYHIQENIALNTEDPTEKELSSIHIELAKEYAKLYLRESGIIYVLTNGDKQNEQR
jgi:hypothetical protein